jgi:hypothetical protein
VLTCAGPRELSINHADAVPQLYASTSRCAKAPFYGATGADHNVSIFAVRNKKIHARRRHAWDRALNGAAQVSYEQVTARLTPRLLAHLEAGEPVDISAWSQYFAYDVMGEVGLGKSFRMLENGGLHPSISWLIDGGWVLPILSAMPWLLRLLMEVYGAFGGSLGGFDDWCKAGMEEKIKVCWYQGTMRSC